MKRAIQICGTGSDVGKSVIASGLCRIFLQDGFRVAPFKAQNMALNSFVTESGGEMGRAQAVQAQACGLKPHVDMNPVLIKPTEDTKAQVIVQGRPFANLSAARYVNHKKKIFKSVTESFNRLKRFYELIVIEGAGSPAEINLKSHDIVNLRMAELADAPVILVGDIDKGGVFASLIGTLELLEPGERERVKGFIINKFRGDKRLLKGGLNFLQKRTSKPVLGVVPYFRDIRIPEEDSVVLENREQRTENREQRKKFIEIAVIKLPHMSNFTDFDPLAAERDVNLYYADERGSLGAPDVVILPGTKNTIGDLAWLRKSGLERFILSTIDQRPSTMLIGICGGYQMLGERIRDRAGVESKKRETEGLGLLSITTDLEEEKVLCQVRAREIETGLDVTGYEIHHGKTTLLGGCRSLFKIVERKAQALGGEERDGMISADSRIWGSYIHGLFDEDLFRRSFLNRIRARKNRPALRGRLSFDVEREFDKLAKLLRDNIDMKLLYKILN